MNKNTRAILDSISRKEVALSKSSFTELLVLVDKSYLEPSYIPGKITFSNIECSRTHPPVQEKLLQEHELTPEWWAKYNGFTK